MSTGGFRRIFRSRPTLFIGTAGGADTSLTGSAVLALTTAAALTTAITLTATATLTATGSGSLSGETTWGPDVAPHALGAFAEPQAAWTVEYYGGPSSIAFRTPAALQGVATCGLTATGALTTQIVLVGSVTGTVTGTGVLTTAIRLAGLSEATVTASATLDEGVGGGAVPVDPLSPIGPGETRVYWLDYTDPLQRDTKIGATDQIPPVATTDYTMNSLATGTGTNLTANFMVTPEFWASAVKLTITNTGGTPGYITKLQVRAKGIYELNPVMAESRDEESIQTYAEQVAHIDMPYQSDPNVGFQAAEYLMRLYANPLSATRSVTFYANQSHALMTAALVGDISDRVGVSETLTGIDVVSFHIQGVRFHIASLDRVQVTWQLGPSAAEAGTIWILDDPIFELGGNTIIGSL